ncbi:phospholipid phosphatase 2-like [Ruditapes philippinarum]|uniref:phospholipid phosphatase 2-like n=1 Tax=Ruditapes philippinarum TaxID=129788 RepID=UPI00295C234C|nr:phospholipid phosphatase 2-like [Ruditapes philippinarum]
MEGSSQKQKYRRQRIIIRIVLDLTIWLAASVVAFYLFLYGKPYERGFFCEDTSLSYPSIPETISTHVLVAVGLTISLLMVICVELLNCINGKCRPRCKCSVDVIFCVQSYIVFMIGFLVQELFVDAIKNKTGALRPNFFDVCKPQFNTTLCPGYISEYTCAGSDNKEIRSSRQSFPSGHSSLAMYIAIYFSIYIENRLNIRYTRLLKIFIQFGLILAAILCGLGRIRENKHHSSDVIAGFILGLAVAIFVYTVLWRRYVKEKRVKNNYKNSINKPRDCFCTCARPSDIDPHTSASVQNEYTKRVENGRSSSSTKLIELQNDDNQNILVTSEIHV